MQTKYDFVSIGDTVTDAFIRLKDISAHVDVDKGTREICMRFADKIPYDSVTVVPAVGNSANAAVSASRLGLRSALITNIGDDYFGKECLAALKAEGVGDDYIKIHKGAKTNYHYVLWYEDDRTILIKHEKYTYSLPDVGSPKWIYLSSLGADADGLYAHIESYLKHHPEVDLAFQPGTYQIKRGKEKMAYFYRRAKVFFCNKQEAERILGTHKTDLKTLLKGIRNLGVEIVVITDGPKGAYVHAEEKFWYMRDYPDPKPPYERTGAGDAFSSTFTVALAYGLSVTDALRWAPINSMSVVQYVGAREGLLKRKEIEKFLKKAPKDYHPREF